MEPKDEKLARIRDVIEKEKKAARGRFRAAEFRARLESRLLASDEPEPNRLARPSPSRSLPRFLLARPLAAASLGAALIAVLAALWFFVLSPSPQRPPATLPEHILEVLLQSSPSQPLAPDPAASSPPGPRVFTAPRPTPDHEIPVIFFKVLESLSPDRPALEIPAFEEERASPTADKLLFQEILKRIKEA